MHILKSSLLPLLACLLAPLISSCVSGTDYQKRLVIPVTQNRVESAIRSTYLIPSGADVSVRYAENSVFYVAKGATLRAFEKKAKNSRIIADDQANLILNGESAQSSYTIKNVDDAEHEYNEHVRATPYQQRRSGYYSTGYYPYGHYSSGYYNRGYGYGHGGYGYGHRSGRKQAYVRQNKAAIKGALNKKFKN